MSRLSLRPSKAGLALVAVLVLGTFTLLPTPAMRVGFEVGINGLTVIVTFVALRRHPRGRRRAWGTLCAGMALYFVAAAASYANIFGLIDPLPWPSWPEVLFLLSYVMLGLGISMLRPGTREGGQRGNWGTLVDALIVTGGLVVASWEYLIEPTFAASSVSFSARAVSVAYPVLDLVLLVVAVRLALRKNARSSALPFVGGFVALLLAADVVYALAQLSGSFRAGGWSDGLWLASFLCLAAAALDPDLPALSEPADVEDSKPGWQRQVFMTASVLLAPALLVTHGDNVDARDVYVHGVVSAVLFALAVARVGGYSRRLAHQARHDALTGLPNRVLLLEQLRHAIDSPSSHDADIAVLFVDLDGFKLVNDTCGHDAGDELLVSVARRLAGAVRSDDIVGRLGGDEFVVVCYENASRSSAEAIADRVAGSLAAPFRIRERDLYVTASIGIAVGRQDKSPDELLRDADAAMYEAKRAGRARYTVFEEDMHRQLVEYLELQAELREALARDELFLQYQPIVDLASGALLGFEALVRWRHPVRGVLPPAAFVPMAEETGLIVPIGRWVTAEACRRLAEWQAAHPSLSDLVVSVNISPVQFAYSGVVDDVRGALADSGLDPGALVLELTENALVDDVDALNARIAPLKALGVRIALDDFGTGYSSLLYLAQMQVDIVKIDRSFVHQGSTYGGKGDLLAEAIVRLAQTLGLDTIAEGIEEPAEAARIRRTGCRAAQGFLFARPLDAVDATACVERAAAGRGVAVTSA